MEILIGRVLKSKSSFPSNFVLKALSSTLSVKMPTTNETSIGDNPSQDDFVFAPVYAVIPSMICVSILISNIIILVTEDFRI